MFFCCLYLCLHFLIVYLYCMLYLHFAFRCTCNFYACSYIFIYIYDQKILPQALQESVLPQLGFPLGLIVGCVYILVVHERKKK